MTRKRIPKNPSLTPGITGEVNVGSNYSEEEAEFLYAVDKFKTLFGRPFLSNREILEIVFSLGYRKVATARPPRPLDGGPVTP